MTRPRPRDGAPRGFPFPLPPVMERIRFKGRRWFVVEHGLSFGTGSITGNRLMKVSVWLECPKVTRARPAAARARRGRCR